MHTTNYGSASLTFHKATVKARLVQRQVWRKVADIEGADIESLAFFVDFITLVQVEGDIGFNIPPLTAEEDEIQACYHALMGADDELYFILVDGVAKANEPIVKRELTPETDLDDKKK